MVWLGFFFFNSCCAREANSEAFVLVGVVVSSKPLTHNSSSESCLPADGGVYSALIVLDPSACLVALNRASFTPAEFDPELTLNSAEMGDSSRMT